MEYKWRNKKKIEFLEAENLRRSAKETELELLKITKPDLLADLYYDNNAIGVVVTFLNKVPIEYTLEIKNLQRINKNLIILSRGTLPKVYPRYQNYRIRLPFAPLKDYILPADDMEISFELRYRSIYASERIDLDLSGRIIKKYLVNFAKNSMIEQ